ncbi:MAG: hypothetical protein AAFX79_13405 [Planctomycetota bacterium]
MTPDTTNALPQAASVLTHGLIDYAGLFPPASLDMPPAAENYARYLRGANAAMLGRLICPAGRLDELTKHAQILMPGTYATSGYREMAEHADPWRISAIVPHNDASPVDDSLEHIRAFNHRHEDEDQGLAVVDAIETPVKAVDEIDALLDVIPEQLQVAIEVPGSADDGVDVRGYVAALAGTGAAAKIRCGGVTPDLFPSAARIVGFMIACRTAGVAFKCTAGLHHALPGAYRLTYENGSATGTMHGFVNVFTAAVLIGARAIDEAAAIELLGDRDAASFVVTDGELGWRNHRVPVAVAAEQRSRFALGYGSCSFDEPTEELAALLRESSR